MANPIQIKRTSVSGRAANTTTLTNPGELAINMTDGIMYSTNGSVVFEVGANLSSLAISGTPAINSSGYWVGPSLYAQQEDYIYSITTSTSVITGADDNSDVLSYTAGLESVFINGVRQIAGVDYATTNATAITLTDPVVNNDVVQVINFEGSIEATNVDAQFAWTNTHTFSNTVTINDKLGIGTASPSVKLDVNGSVRFVDSTSAGPDLEFGNVGGSTKINNVANARNYYGAYEHVFTNFDNSTEHMRLDTSGNLGIGTSSPGARVDLGYTSASVALRISRNASNRLDFYQAGGVSYIDSSPASAQLAFSTVGTERMRITSAGNVGIGTTSPLGLLEVANITEAASEDTQVWFTTRGTGSGSDVILNLVCENTTTGETFINFGDSAATDAGQLRYNHDGDSMEFRTATSERMRIDSSGNVGIGTSSPSNPLDIEASTATVDINMTNTANRAEINLQESGTTKGILQYRGSTNGTLPGTMRIGTQGSDDLIFNTAGAERMRVLGTGNVGIGTTSPSAKLNVVTTGTNSRIAIGDGAVGTYSTLLMYGGSGKYNFQLGVQNNINNAFEITPSTAAGGTTFSTPAFVINSSGNVGIGTSSPGARLETYQPVGGTNAIRMNTNFAGGNYVDLNPSISGVSNGGFSITLNGLIRQVIDTSGNVGIGTSSPSAVGSRTTVNVSGSAGSAIRLSDDTANIYIDYTDGSGARISVNAAEPLLFQTNSLERMRIDSSGNVGIGTSSPDSKVDIEAANSQLRLTDSDDSKFVEFSYSGGKLITRNNSTSTTVNQFTLDGSGRLGIGTISPTSSQLHVYTDTDNAYAAKFDQDHPTGWGVLIDTDATVDTDPALWVKNATDTIMWAGSGGNVGIGTSSPANTNGGLDASGALIARGGIAAHQTSAGAFDFSGNDLRIRSYGATAGTGSIVFRTGGGGGSTDTERGRISGDGQWRWGDTATIDTVSYLPFQITTGISINTTSTAPASAMSFFNGQGSGTRVGWIGTNGSATSYNTSSDQRLKENIADADDAGSLLDAIRVRKFDWKLNGEHQAYGMVAQELDPVYPDAVSHGPTEDDMMAVDYSKLVPMLVKEIQSLRARVAQLEGNT